MVRKRVRYGRGGRIKTVRRNQVSWMGGNILRNFLLGRARRVKRRAR